MFNFSDLEAQNLSG